MKIDTSPHFNAWTQSTNRQRNADGKQSVNSPQSAPRDTQYPDFTRMTRTQLRSWINDQIGSGKMSLDDSTSFVSLTVNIPLSGQSLSGADDQPVDFMQIVRNGIAGALWRNDHAAAKRLESMLDVMLRNQKQVSGIDIEA